MFTLLVMAGSDEMSLPRVMPARLNGDITPWSPPKCTNAWMNDTLCRGRDAMDNPGPSCGYMGFPAAQMRVQTTSSMDSWMLVCSLACSKPCTFPHTYRIRGSWQFKCTLQPCIQRHGFHRPKLQEPSTFKPSSCHCGSAIFESRTKSAHHVFSANVAAIRESSIF